MVRTEEEKAKFNEFKQLFEAKLKEFRYNKELFGEENRVNWLLSMLAAQCEVNGREPKLFIKPFGRSHRLINAYEEYPTIPVKNRPYDCIVKEAIIQSIENVIFMYSMHLKELKENK